MVWEIVKEYTEWQFYPFAKETDFNGLRKDKLIIAVHGIYEPTILMGRFYTHEVKQIRDFLTAELKRIREE